jgi:hypothetical protein
MTNKLKKILATTLIAGGILWSLSLNRGYDFSKDSEEVLLAKAIYGEARGCSNDERIAVAYTAINRTHDGILYNGEGNLKKVLLYPKQYKCFSERNENTKKLAYPQKDEPAVYQECLGLSRDILAGKYKDPTGGANMYFKKEPKFKNPEKVKKIGKIGDSKHIFYKEK